MLGRARKQPKRPPSDEARYTMMAIGRAQMRDLARARTAENARRVIEAANQDPTELLAPTPEQLATVEESAVAAAFGIRPGSVRCSRDGTTSVFILAGPPVSYDEEGRRL